MGESAKEDAEMGDRIKKVFKKFDADESGDISCMELSKVLTKLNPTFTLTSCSEMFRHIDADKDGSIQYDEFVNWLTSKDGEYRGVKASLRMLRDEFLDGSFPDDEKRANKRSQLRVKFEKWDRNHDKELTFEEAYNFLRKRYPDMTLPDLKFLYNCADKSHNGKLDFYELLDFIMTVPPQKSTRPDGEEPLAPALPTMQFRADEEEVFAEAVRKYEEDQKRMLAKVNELCDQLKKVGVQEEKHKKFRENHAKEMRDLYAKKGVLEWHLREAPAAW
eukprot:TRINITY_DN49893_c0_g1_i1.p1 TRINITY_DN49893_c0_g1~~TRINITY_DN49893_c0_g1_i1.p1  ORF type:complete len:297 (+),score=82.08 TRINITY_DN49893_c0_g1_i1:66-893(+)